MVSPDPSQTLILLTLDPHSITKMASFSTRDVLNFCCWFIALYCSPHSAAQVQGCTMYTGEYRYILTFSQLLLTAWNGNNKVLKHYYKICIMYMYILILISITQREFAISCIILDHISN